VCCGNSPVGIFRTGWQGKKFCWGCQSAYISRISYQSADFELLKEMVSLNKGIFTFPDNSLDKIDTQDIKGS
jgi:hypothetical protein